MMIFDTEYIDVINVPAHKGNDYTNFDRSYFDFKYKDTPKFLQSKRSPLTVTFILASFVYSFFAPTDATKALFRALALIFCLWNFYEQRYVLLYNRAEKFSYQKRYYPRMIRSFNRILKSKRVYIEGMPIAYYILKAKELLYKRDVITAEYLIDNALKISTNCPEAKYVKALCLYLDGKTAKAKKIFDDVSKIDSNQPIKDAALKILRAEWV